MEGIKLKPADDGEKELGTVAMFGYGFGNQDHRAVLSRYYLLDIVNGGLEILTVVFLLLILCEYISVHNFVYILVPFALIYFLTAVDSTVVDYHFNPSGPQYIFDYFMLCLSCTPMAHLGALLFIFCAKSALIFVYSKNLNDAVNLSQSLSALADSSLDRKYDTIVPSSYFIMAVVLICFNLILESWLLLSRIKSKGSIRQLYAFVLSLVDTLGCSIFFLIHRVIGRQNEFLHFNKIITNLPKLFVVVAAVRCLVWVFTLFALAKNNERRCVYSLGMTHFCVAIFNGIFYGLTNSRFLFSLKVICCAAIVERLLLIDINVYLSYLNRGASLSHLDLKSGNDLNEDQSSDQGSLGSLDEYSPPSSPSQQASPIAHSPSTRANPSTARSNVVFRTSSHSVSDANQPADDSDNVDEQQGGGAMLGGNAEIFIACKELQDQLERIKAEKEAEEKEEKKAWSKLKEKGQKIYEEIEVIQGEMSQSRVQRGGKLRIFGN